MNFARRLAKLEQTIVPGLARCRVCGYLMHPAKQHLSAMVIYADGSWWDTTPRCECGHVLMANGKPYPMDEASPPSGLTIINTSHYAIMVGGKGEIDLRYPLRTPRRLPPEWWGQDGEPTRPRPEVTLCPVEAKMVSMAIAMEREAAACL